MQGSIWLLERKDKTDVEWCNNGRYTEYNNISEASKNRIKNFFPPISSHVVNDDGWEKDRSDYTHLPFYLFVERHPIYRKTYSLLTVGYHPNLRGAG